MRGAACPKRGRYVAVYAKREAVMALLAHHKNSDGVWCRWQRVEVKRRLEQSNHEGKQA